jgi:hypothetical protein
MIFGKIKVFLLTSNGNKPKQLPQDPKKSKKQAKKTQEGAKSFNKQSKNPKSCMNTSEMCKCAQKLIHE